MGDEMNKENLNSIFKRYIDKFDDITGIDGNHENKRTEKALQNLICYLE